MSPNRRSGGSSSPAVPPPHAHGRRRALLPLGLGAALLLLFLTGCLPPAPNPEPTPTPIDCPDTGDLPWCHETGQTCGECLHQPPGEECPVLAPECPEAPPDPGPGPGPEPPPGECKLETPPAHQVPNATIRVKREGRFNIGATPFGRFGKDYYCSAEMNWPEACAEGKIQGPVAPDGHPQRVACEQVFLGACGPTFSMATCTGTGAQCPLTFDPFFVVDGVNQNHPRNVEAGCGGKFTDDPSWVKQGGHIVEGNFWLASAHGKGYVKACDSTGTACGVSNFEIDH